MIATVKMAPLEQWNTCPTGIAIDEYAQHVVGMEVQILTDSCFQSDCGPRWRLTEESVRRLNKAAGTWGQPNCVCSHQLEMD